MLLSIVTEAVPFCQLLVHRNATFLEEPTEISQSALGYWLSGCAQWQ